MSQTLIACHLQIAPVRGAQEGKVVRIQAKALHGGQRLALIEVNLEDFARAIMSGSVVQATFIEEGR